MSFQNKKGKTSARNKMIIRQQVSDVLANNKIITTHTKAKETQRHVDKIISLTKKKNTLAAKRAAASILLTTSKLDSSAILNRLFTELADKYKDRNGGYTRVLKLGSRSGDNAEEAILELV
jgi:large subunit ribosomal protein L17